MNNKQLKILISLSLVLSLNSPVFAESLFRAGVSEDNFSIQPRSLFSSVKAKSIGDIVTININEQTETSDNLTFISNDETTTTDNFRTLWNKILPGKPIPDGIDGFGGNSDINKTASSIRRGVLRNTITAQVVQVLPNGNLLVQGKKTTINAKEKMNIIVSGIVDPRLLNSLGSINSNQVANLQLAIVGKGSISRSSSESPISKYIRYLF